MTDDKKKQSDYAKKYKAASGLIVLSVLAGFFIFSLTQRHSEPPKADNFARFDIAAELPFSEENPESYIRMLEVTKDDIKANPERWKKIVENPEEKSADLERYIQILEALKAAKSGE